MIAGISEETAARELTPADRFKCRRQATGLSQWAFAKLIGKSERGVQRWEAGDRAIHPYVWRLLAAVEADLAKAKQGND